MPDEKKPEDEKLVIVDEEGEPTPPPEKKEKPPEEKETSEEDQRVGHSEEEEEDDEESGKTDEEREAIRVRRRQERKNRRERDSRIRKEVNFLRKRNEQVERQLSQLVLRQNQQEDVSIDQRIGQIDSQIKQAEEIHSAAVKNNDGETATEALRIKDQLLETSRQLTGAKRARETQRPTAAAQPTQETPEITPGAQAALEWVKKNEWFDPGLRDETSHLVKVLEDRLALEGEYSADEPEYWEELDRRISKRFPQLKKAPKMKQEEVFDEDDEEEPKPQPKPKKKSGGPVFTVGGRTRPLKSNEVFLNAERRQALEEMGLEPGSADYERYLRSYKRYDEEAAKNS